MKPISVHCTSTCFFVTAQPVYLSATKIIVVAFGTHLQNLTVSFDCDSFRVCLLHYQTIVLMVVVVKLNSFSRVVSDTTSSSFYYLIATCIALLEYREEV